MVHKGRIVALVASVLVGAGFAGSPAQASEIDSDADTWTQAAQVLGPTANGALYEPLDTIGLTANLPVQVIAYDFVPSTPAGEMTVTAQYGRISNRVANFSVLEKFQGTDWAADPSFTTSAALIGSEKVQVGVPGQKYSVNVTYWADCFDQPATGNPKRIPSGFRCKYADLAKGGGYAQVSMRPANTMVLPATPTTVFITSTMISHSQLVRIIRGLSGIAPQ